MSDLSDRLLRLPEVLARTGLKRSTLYRKVEAGTFPQQVSISPRCIAWRQSEVDDWVRNPMFYSVDEHVQSGAAR